MKVESAFFEILETDELTSPFAVPNAEHGRKFYKFVAGPKTIFKERAMNNCLNLFVNKTYYKKDGRPYQPNTLTHRLKVLFAVFRQHGIIYSRSKDFQYEGGFARNLSVRWGAENASDATFGARPTKNQLPDDYDRFIRKQIKAGWMDLEDPFDVANIFGFLLGTLYGFRGVKVRTTFLGYYFNYLLLTIYICLHRKWHSLNVLI